MYGTIKKKMQVDRQNISYKEVGKANKKTNKRMDS